LDESDEQAIEALSHGRLASRYSMEGLAAGYGRCVFPIESACIERVLFDDAALGEAQTAALGIRKASGRREI
jgi:hypothetical protein